MSNLTLKKNNENTLQQQENDRIKMILKEVN